MGRLGHRIRLLLVAAALAWAGLTLAGGAQAQDVFASSGGDDYGDVFASNGDDGDDSGPGPDIFSSNGTPDGNPSSGGNYPLPPLPCGMNALEGQAWAGPGSSAFLGMLSDLTRPACQQAFHMPNGTVCHRPQSYNDEGDAASHYAAFRPGRDGGEGRDLLIPVQAGGGGSGRQPGLWVGGAQISSPKQLRGMMLFLGGGSTAGTYQPSHLWLREQIFIAMSCHPHRRFEFQTTKDLEINILIRANAVVALGTTATTCSFPARNQAPSLAGGDWESYSDPRASLLERVPLGQLKNSNPFANLLGGGVEHVAFRSIDGVQATQAIDAVITRNSVLDCQLGVEASMLAAIRRALDAQFDQLHPQSASHPNALTGLGIPLTAVSVTVTSGNSVTARANANRDTAFGFHMVPVMFLPLNPCNPHGLPIRQVTGNLAFNQRPILAEDMVPGDYAYLSNPPDYETWHPGGNSNGENALFAGRKKGKPLFEVHGITGPIPEADLKVAARDAYNLKPAVTQAPPVCDGMPAPTFQKIETDGVTWTLLAGPTRAGDPKEAGPYVR